MLLIDEGLEILDEDECRSLLRQHDVGRIGVSMRALPAIFPVYYTVDEDEIVFRSSPGVKLSAAARHSVVAFEVDDVNPGRDAGWSVLVIGTAREVTDADEIARLARLPIPTRPGGQPDHFVRIAIRFISGRRFTPGTPIA